MKNLTKFDWLIIVFISIYFLIFSVISVNRYWQYQTTYYDFGIYDEAIWKVSRFRLPLIDKGENGKIQLADHFTPGIYLLSPIYWFTDRREALFITQVLAVSLSAWIGYCLTRSRTNNRFVQVALLVSFLGFTGTQNALISDIHEVTFAVLPLMLVFWAIERKKPRHYWFFLLLLLSFKENLAGVAVGIGFYLLFRNFKANLTTGLITILLGLGWGITTTGYIIPHLNDGTYFYSPLHLNGLTLPQILSLFVSGNNKLYTLFSTFSAFGFLPLFDLSVWPLLFEHFLERFVLSTSGTRSDLGLHYSSILIPILFISSLNTITFWAKRISRRILSIGSLLIIIWIVGFNRYIYPGPIGLFFNPVFYAQRNNVTYQDDFVKLFPRTGLVLTQNDLAVRLTHGCDIRLLRENFSYLHPDYVIINLTPGQNPNSYYPVNYETAVKIRDYYANHPEYLLTKMHTDQYLFSRKDPSLPVLE